MKKIDIEIERYALHLHVHWIVKLECIYIFLCDSIFKLCSRLQKKSSVEYRPRLQVYKHVSIIVTIYAI